MPTLASTSRIAIVIALAALVAACSGGDPDKLLASAKDYLAKHDTKSAEIQLKNALEKAPDMAEARYLLGRTLLENGDVASAEKELRRAKDLKFPSGKVDPPLAKAWVLQGRYKEVIDTMSKATGDTPTDTAELMTALGQAELGLGNVERAKADYAAAQASDAKYAPAILGLAVIQGRAGDIDGAVALADKALEASPKLPEALEIKGDLMIAKGRVGDATALYREAISTQPSYIAAHWSLVSALIRDGKIDEADKALAALKAVAPKHPKTFYYEALVRSVQRNYPAARDAIQQELALVPDEPAGMMLSASIDYELKSYDRAQATLEKVLSRNPRNDFARRLLVTTYLRQRQSQKALETLKPMLDHIGRDAAMQNIAGEVYLQTGDVDQAGAHFEKAAQLDPKGMRAKAGLAMTRLAQGDPAGSLKELEEAASNDTGVQSDLMLISIALRNRSYDEALAAIAKLEKKQPDQPLASNLRGLALLGKRDLAGARQSFERALTLDPAYFPAVASLARVDIAEKKPEAAQRRLEDFVAKNPKSTQAMLALADVRAASGASPGDVEALIVKAIKVDPAQLQPHLALVRHYLQHREPRKAVLAAQDGLNASPNRIELLDALGQSQQAAGQSADALATFRRYAEAAPDSPVPSLRMATVQLSQHDTRAAADSFRHALIVRPDDLDAQKGLAAIAIGDKKIADAVAIAKDVQKQRPKEPVGFVLEGDIHAVGHEPSKAAQAYRQALAVAPNTEAAAKLHGVLLVAGQKSEADKAAAEWLRAHPGDDGYKIAIADQATERKDYAAAMRYYSEALQRQPDNAILLNNYAWVAGQINDSHAIEYAERANKIAPNQPRILDTLGSLLVDKGDAKRGVDLLQQAVSLAPQIPAIRLNLARAYVKTGQSEAAKKELDTLAGLGDKFAQQDEVARLRRGL
jgi:putative PEP-CTERM system TPR-repeat lipoprotein